MEINKTELDKYLTDAPDPTEPEELTEEDFEDDDEYDEDEEEFHRQAVED